MKLDPGRFPCIFVVSLLEIIEAIRCYWGKIIVHTMGRETIMFINVVAFWKEGVKGFRAFPHVWPQIQVISTSRKQKFSGHIANLYYYLLPEPDVLKTKQITSFLYPLKQSLLCV